MIGNDGSTPLSNARQEAFAHDCVVMSHSDAYRKNYPASRKWKAQTVAKAAHRLMSHVCSRIDFLRLRASEQTGITAVRVLNEIAKIAFIELPGIVDLRGGVMTMTDFNQLGRPDQRAALKRVKITEDIEYDEEGNETGKVRRVEFEVWDKLAALELLGKHLKLWNNKSALDGVPIVEMNLNFDGNQVIRK